MAVFLGLICQYIVWTPYTQLYFMREINAGFLQNISFSLNDSIRSTSLCFSTCDFQILKGRICQIECFDLVCLVGHRD